MTTIGIRTKRGFVDTPDGQIHYCIGGSGDPLLLLHQSPRSSNEYADMIPILAQKFRVIAMDTMGYGDSDKTPRPYSVEDYAKTVIMLLDALGIRRTNMVGHHTGSFIATEAAASHPERIDKLILSGCFYMNEGARKDLLNRKQWEVDKEGKYLLEMFLWGVKRSGDPHIAHRRVLDLLKAGETTEWSHWAVAKYYPDTRWPLIQSPTLLIWGGVDLQRQDASGWNATEGAKKVEKLIPRCRAILVPDAATYFPSEKPKEFARLILEFLERPGV